MKIYDNTGTIIKKRLLKLSAKQRLQKHREAQGLNGEKTTFKKKLKSVMQIAIVWVPSEDLKFCIS